MAQVTLWGAQAETAPGLPPRVLTQGDLPSLRLVDVELTTFPVMAYLKVSVCCDHALPTHHVMKKFMDFQEFHGAVAREITCHEMLPALPRSRGEQELCDAAFRTEMDLYLGSLARLPGVVETYSFRNFFQLSEEYQRTHPMPPTVEEIASRLRGDQGAAARSSWQGATTDFPLTARSPDASGVSAVRFFKANGSRSARSTFPHVRPSGASASCFAGPPAGSPDTRNVMAAVTAALASAGSGAAAAAAAASASVAASQELPASGLVQSLASIRENQRGIVHWSDARPPPTSASLSRSLTSSGSASTLSPLGSNLRRMRSGPVSAANSFNAPAATLRESHWTESFASLLRTPVNVAPSLQRQPHERIVKENSQNSSSEMTSSTDGPPTRATRRRRPWCVVCMTNPQEVAIDPCGHLSMCHSCSSAVKACPVCRGPITKALR
eukprot:CAMPEP_0170577028 /NCGR_PEP_ID=MMETSP0224-20130122/4705_1 /TAXON_ID=285029 /ORGANISM="Togula jolla, Strain CCCM 725" /LENGTH=439 /DNA_ID=CAMNT_0010899905 /DNA_START=83 /DNA_END=1398 /DNA_ORIENTATION=+